MRTLAERRRWSGYRSMPLFCVGHATLAYRLNDYSKLLLRIAWGVEVYAIERV
jgi:hypothetical protein